MSRRSLWIGGGAGLLMAAVLAPATGNALSALYKARAERDALAAQIAAPPWPVPLVASGLAIPARDPGAAQAWMTAQVQRLAHGGGVLVEEIAPMPAAPGLAGIRLRISGSEKAVLALADMLERERPLLRLVRWQVDPAPGGIRLHAELIGALQ